MPGSSRRRTSFRSTPAAASAARFSPPASMPRAESSRCSRDEDTAGSRPGLALVRILFYQVAMLCDVQVGGPAFFRAPCLGIGPANFLLFAGETMDLQDRERSGGGAAAVSAPRPGRARQLQENVVKVGLHGGDVDDREAGRFHRIEELGDPRPARLVVEDEA